METNDNPRSHTHSRSGSWGHIILDARMADDLSVVNSARVSFDRHSDDLGPAELGLISFLMREHHGTPFEHNSFRFIVKTPIFVAREWFRHRVGWSYNEFSARYSQMNDEWYVPDVSSVRSQVGKPGSYSFEPIVGHDAEEIIDAIDGAQAQAFRTYTWLISQGCAKELARTVLPVGMFTKFYATCNARSLMHFVALRNHPNAQKEIREAANALEEIFAEIMPYTYEAFLRHGRIAP